MKKITVQALVYQGESMRITTKWLEDNDACPGEIENFKLAFPGGASITKKNCILASQCYLSLVWLSIKLGVQPYFEMLCEPHRVQLRQDLDAALGLHGLAYNDAREKAYDDFNIAYGIAFWEAYKRRAREA